VCCRPSSHQQLEVTGLQKLSLNFEAAVCDAFQKLQ